MPCTTPRARLGRALRTATLLSTGFLILVVARVPTGFAQEADGAIVEPTEEPATVSRGLSWNLLGGGIPSGGSIIEAGLGFSGLPHIAYHYGTGNTFSIGGSFSFDYAYWAPDFAFTPGILLQAPMRISLSNSDSFTFGLRLDPGIGFVFPKGGGFLLGILLNASANFGIPIQNRFILGGGVDIPMALFVGDATIFAIPLLFGPIFEFHVTPPLAITFDLKFGPHIDAGDAPSGAGSHVFFGMKIMAGIAYRF